MERWKKQLITTASAMLLISIMYLTKPPVALALTLVVWWSVGQWILYFKSVTIYGRDAQDYPIYEPLRRYIVVQERIKNRELCNKQLRDNLEKEMGFDKK